MTTVLLTGAGGSATANVIDALRRGATVPRIVGADNSVVRLHMSTADERAIVPQARDEAWALAIRSLCETFRVDVVHCQPDPEVLALGRVRDHLPARTFLPAQRTLELASDKQAFADAMAHAGVAAPESHTFTTRDELYAVMELLLARHPTVWVRARVGAGARGSLPVSTAAQAEAWIAWWTAERGLHLADFMAAERLPGREFAYQSLWQDGELVVGQARERVEYLYGHLTPHGQTSTPAVARTVKDPRIDDVAQAAVRAMDPSPNGIFCVDVKEALDGVPKVTEVNAGRFFTTSNFFAAAGCNMPEMFVRAALGERLPRLGSSPLPADLYWIRMVDMTAVLVEGDRLDAWLHADR